MAVVCDHCHVAVVVWLIPVWLWTSVAVVVYLLPVWLWTSVAVVVYLPPVWLWSCGCLLSGCCPVAVSCVAVHASGALMLCCFAMNCCGLLGDGGCCRTGHESVVLLHECNLSTEPLCVSVCRGITFPSVFPVEGYRADVDPRRDSWADINPYSPSASSSSQWLGLRFSRLLGKMLKGPAGPM